MVLMANMQMQFHGSSVYLRALRVQLKVKILQAVAELQVGSRGDSSVGLWDTLALTLLLLACLYTEGYTREYQCTGSRGYVQQRDTVLSSCSRRTNRREKIAVTQACKYEF